jgi:hypothetical protein
MAVFNGTERIPQSLEYCAAYQRQFNRIFVGAWLLFSALELWGAWAIYGGPPVQRVKPDRGMRQPIVVQRSLEISAGGTKPLVWLSVRIVIVLYCLVAGWRGFGEPVSIPGAILVFAALWGAIGTRYGIVQAYTSTSRTEPWLLPSWFLNPFQRSQPFQFFQLFGLSAVAFGLPQVLRALVNGKPFSFGDWPPEMFGAAFGLGILLGIYWAVSAYRSKFQHAKVF